MRARMPRSLVLALLIGLLALFDVRDSTIIGLFCRVRALSIAP